MPFDDNERPEREDESEFGISDSFFSYDRGDRLFEEKLSCGVIPKARWVKGREPRFDSSGRRRWPLRSTDWSDEGS